MGVNFHVNGPEFRGFPRGKPIFLVPFEGFEGVKIFPQLHYAPSSKSPAPKASTMPLVPTPLVVPRLNMPKRPARVYLTSVDGLVLQILHINGPIIPDIPTDHIRHTKVPLLVSATNPASDEPSTPKTRGVKTRQAYSRFTGVNSREFVRNWHEFRTNFVRIPRDFTQTLPLCTPSFVPRKVRPPTSLHAPWPQATTVSVRVVLSCPSVATPEPPL